jgi:hypothetical protein
MTCAKAKAVRFDRRFREALVPERVKADPAKACGGSNRLNLPGLIATSGEHSPL